MQVQMIDRKQTLKDGTEIVIRQAVPDDAEQMINLVQNILGTTIYTLTTVEEFDANEDAQAAWIQEYLDNPNWILLVAEHDGELIGNLDFRNNPKLRNQHAGEFGMGIRDTYRNKGIGKAILDVFLEWANDSSTIEKINLSVMSTNEVGVNLYQNLGFIEQGRHPKAIRVNDTFIDVIQMYMFV